MHPAAPRNASLNEALWSWVQACPAVHLVSRKLPPAPPHFPHGFTLHDAVLARSALRAKSEETLYAEDRFLAGNLRRGLSFIQASDGGIARVIRRGLPKFFDLDHGAVVDALARLSDTSSTSASTGSHSQRTFIRDTLAADLAQGLASAWRSGGRVSFTRLTKANGENAQVSFFAPTQQWVLCSKNVALLAQRIEDVSAPEWGDQRYRFARCVAQVWFSQLQAAGLSQVAALQEQLSHVTLVGELLGFASHLVSYEQQNVHWFAVVPHESTEACWPPKKSLDFFEEHCLPAVQMVGKESWHADDTSGMERLLALVEEIDRAAIDEAGEGCVIYAVAQGIDAGGRIDNAEQVLWLSKVKTAEYRLLRRMREKAKGFARSSGSMLIEDAVANYRSGSMMSPGERFRIHEHALAFEKLCRYIFAEDLPAEVVDADFLHVLAKAKESTGMAGPRPPAPVICLIAPPLLVPQSTLVDLQDMLQKHACAATAPPDVPRFSKDILTSIWHRSTASQGLVCLNHVPIAVERALALTEEQDVQPEALQADEADDAEEDRPRKRRKKVSMAERRASVSQKLQQMMQSSRCLFLFAGWSEEACQHSLKRAAECSASASASALRREARGFIEATASQQRSLLRKWTAHAHRLQSKLPKTSALSLELPSPLSAIGVQCRPASTSSVVVDALRRLASGQPVCTVLVIMVLGLPGMGKSTLLDRLYDSFRTQSKSCFRQGTADGHCDSSTQPTFAGLALLSSDVLTGQAMQKRGIQPDSASEQDFQDCKEEAAHVWRCGIADFLESAATEGGRALATANVPKFLLILDKNFPPRGLTSEVELLLAAAPHGCELRLQTICLTGMGGPVQEHPEEELKPSAAWRYPWSQEVVIECAARLLQRTDHETLAGGTTGLWVLLSFLKLHRGERLDAVARSINAQFRELPYLALSGPLASWAEGSIEGETASVRQRLEVQAALTEVLQTLRPFGKAESVQPLLEALVKHLSSAGLRTAAAASLQEHGQACCEALRAQVLALAQDDAAPQSIAAHVVPVTYVALSVEEHSGLLEQLLSRAMDAMRCSAGSLGVAADADAFPVPPCARPDFLHLTTLYTAASRGGQLSAERRSLLARSRQLCRENAAYDCVISHVVCCRGALATAVVELAPLQSAGLPLAAEQPHITLRVRAPWKPKHSNDVLRALDREGAFAALEAQPPPPPSLPPRSTQLPPPPPGAPPIGLANATTASPEATFLGSGAADVGRWWKNLQVSGAVVDVFVLRFGKPVVLPKNPLTLI